MTTPPPAPRHEPDGPLEFAPADWDERSVYHLLSGLIVPRPIGWISTLGPDGVRNLAPFSFFNAVAAYPPHVMFSMNEGKDTARNVTASREFVVNIVTRGLIDRVHRTSARVPPHEDEFDLAGLSASPSVAVRAPRVTDAPAHLECRLVRLLDVSGWTVAIGEVVHVHVAAGIYHDGRVDPQRLDPVGRLAGGAYTTLGETFRLPPAGA
jgi:flavin reductase (DIM6/NTAB) family NADH-FMN oxidoreductase RutF